MQLVGQLLMQFNTGWLANKKPAEIGFFVVLIDVKLDARGYTMSPLPG